jgi:hypothetical protein
MSGYTFGSYPKPTGYWLLPGAVKGVGFQLTCYKKPRWLTIKLMYWVLEFEYKEFEYRGSI